MTQYPQMIYLGRARMHRSRANLIQTLHTIEAFEREGVSTRLYLPPWPRDLDVPHYIHELGIDRPLDVRPSQLLHPRFRFWPFVRWHRRMLQAAPIVYTRVPEISRLLGDRGIVHHLEVHDAVGLWNLGLMERLVAHHQAGRLGVLLPTCATGGEVLIEAGAVRERIHVAPNGVDYEKFSQVEPFDPTRLERPRIVYLGKATASRGLPVFEALARTGWCDVTLVGDQTEAMNSDIKTVPFVPHRFVPDWYGKMDVAVIPYHFDPIKVKGFCPIKLFEAMAAGRPIIISDLEPLHEWVVHEETALLVDPADPDAWVAAVDRLRQDLDLAARLAKNAADEADKYSWLERGRGILGAIRAAG